MTVLHLKYPLKEQYAKLKTAEEKAANSGLYETQGERRFRQMEENADFVEVWPQKRDVAQLESMIEWAPGPRAPRGDYEGV